ncbi:MAG: ABC transporter permease [Deltaproteobacteria bacterium]|nr:ABC transporter permease [Deltaproteobacteria bacterium]
MNLSDIVFRNLLRRKAKALFVLAGLAIGVATVVALISFVEAMTSQINHKLEKYGANILIVPKTENLSLSYGGLSLGGVSFEMEEIREADLEKIGSIKNAANVAGIGPMVFGVVNVNDHKVLLAGVDLESTWILKPWWKIDGTIPRETGVILGAETAKVLDLKRGSSLQIKEKDFIVSGVLKPTGSQDDQLLFMPLGTAQSLLNKEGLVSMAKVAALCKDCPIDAMVRQISEAVPGARVMAIQQVVKGRMETLAQFKTFSYGVSLVVVLVGSLVVLVTMMGSVRERTEEIGIFRAIGFRKTHVFKIVLLEAGFISAVAGILGYFAGFGVTKGALQFFSESGGASVLPSINLAAGAVGLAILVGLASSIYPAFLAARMDPNQALNAM